MEEKVLSEIDEIVGMKLASNTGEKQLGEIEETLVEEEVVPLGWYGTGWGKIKYLRCNDIGHVWGGGNDALYTEVIVKISSAPDHAFGFHLRPGDPDLPANLAMLSVLRDAFVHNLDVLISFHSDGNKNCEMRRVEIRK
jgi:hypothetical protein